MALLDNGCKVNTVTQAFIEAHTLKIGPMSNLVEGRVSMVGLGEMHTCTLGYIIIRVQVNGIGGYNEDQIVFIILDFSKFTSNVPVTLGILTIRRVINVIKESKLNALTTPWVNAQVAYLLADNRANMSFIDEKVTNWPLDPTNLNEIMKIKRSEKIKGFLSKVIHAQTKIMFMGCNLHVMTHRLCKGNKPVPHGLAVQNTYTEMTFGSKSIPVVVRNLTAIPILLKMNTPLATLVAANVVPNAQVLPGTVEQLNTTQGIQMGRPKMTVEQWREVLFEQLDLSSLDSWTPKSMAVAHSLLAEYHDIFSLDSCELGCMDVAWHVIKVMDNEPLKERFRWIPPLMVEEVWAHVKEMLEVGAIHPG